MTNNWKLYIRLKGSVGEVEVTQEVESVHNGPDMRKDLFHNAIVTYEALTALNKE